MDPIRTVKLSWVFGGGAPEVAYQLTRFRFTRSVPTWRPEVNVYRFDKCIRICVDLAGVAKADIDLHVLSKRVVIRGTRDVPDWGDGTERAAQMLIMEIDYGPFERTIDLPLPINIEEAHAEQENGFLWISLPIKT